MFLYYNDIELEISVSENNIHINNSFKVKSKKDMYHIIQKIKEKYPENNINKISDFSLIQEWAVHNLCYKLNLFKNRTKDVDLNVDKPCYITLLYNIIGFLYI